MKVWSCSVTAKFHFFLQTWNPRLAARYITEWRHRCGGRWLFLWCCHGGSRVSLADSQKAVREQRGPSHRHWEEAQVSPISITENKAEEATEFLIVLPPPRPKSFFSHALFLEGSHCTAEPKLFLSLSYGCGLVKLSTATSSTKRETGIHTAWWRTNLYEIPAPSWVYARPSGWMAEQLHYTPYWPSLILLGIVPVPTELPFIEVKITATITVCLWKFK